MKQIYISVIVLYLFITGCEEIYINPDAIIQGAVIDSTTFEKISNAKVTAYRTVNCKLRAMEDCNEWESIKSVESDKHGDFILKFKDRNKEYRISASKEGYYKSGYWYKVSKDIENVDCYLFPKGTLILKIVNLYPFDNNDLIEIEVNNHGNRNIDTTYYSFQGTNIDTSIQITLYANFTHQCSWSITKNNILMEFSDSIFFDGSDNVRYSINY